jgi:hypothetical protein
MTLDNIIVFLFMLIAVATADRDQNPWTPKKG